MTHEHIQMMLYGAVLPGALSMILLVVGWRAWRWGGGDGGFWSGAVATAGSYIIAVWATTGVKPWLPVAVQDRLPYLAIGIGLLALLDAALRLPRMVRALLLLASTAGASWVVLWPVVPHQFTAREAAIGVALMTGVLAVLVAVVDWSARHVRGPAIPLAMFFWTACTATVVGMSGSQSLGQFVGGLAAASSAALLVSLRAKSLSLNRGAAFVLITMTLLTLATAFCYGYPVSPLHALPLVGAPLLCAVGMLPWIRRMRPLRQALLIALLVLIPSATAASLAAIEFARSQESSSGDAASYNY